jgi:cytochrome c553
MKTISIMKALPIALGIVIFFIAVSTYGQVMIERVPLSEQQAALTDGKALFDELCVACHGKDGIGNGPAVSALNKAPADLTVLAAKNNGTFPRKEVNTAIGGRFRDDVHGPIGMSSWYKVFQGANPEWRTYRRQIYAMQQIDRLTDYLETIQIQAEVSLVNIQPGIRQEPDAGTSR